MLDETSPLPPPPRSRWPVRLGLALVVAVYLTYSSFGIAAPFLWGHHGYHGATYMLRAKMSIRFAMFTPATAPGFEPPPASAYYFHHPMGYHHVLDLPILLLGDHEWVGRGMAILGGLFTLWALYAMVRRWWSREAGLLAAAVWVALPIITSFSVLVDPMLPAMACSIAVAEALLSYLERPNRRALLRACAFTALGGFLMWEAYFQAVFHALTLLGGALLLRRRVSLGAALRWTVATGASATAMMGFHIGFMVWKGGWEDFLTSYGQRSSATYAYAIDRHKQWLEILYGWPIIACGLLWLLLFLGRLVAGRARMRDHGVLIFFLINTLYIYLFAAASAIHLYRVFWYSTFFTLAVVDLVTDLRAGIAALARPRPRLVAPLSLGAAVVLTLGYFAAVLPHAYGNLLESREMMGTHGQPGYNADYSKQLFGMEVARRTGPEDYVFIHTSLPYRAEFVHYVDRTGGPLWSLANLPPAVKQRPRSVVIMDADVTGSEHRLMLDLLSKHPGYRYDHYLLIDLRSNRPGLHEYIWVHGRTSRWYRWFVSHKYPPMVPMAVNNPWSQCVHAITEVPPPKGTPKPAQVWREDWGLCYHNALILDGDRAAAAAYVEQVRTRAQRRELPLGDLGRVVAFRLDGRSGASIWTLLARPPQSPLPEDQLVGRYRLTPIAVPGFTGRDPIVGEFPLWAGGAQWAMTTRHSGYLYLDSWTWAAPPGRYRLAYEIGRPAPSALLGPPPPARPTAGRAPLPHPRSGLVAPLTAPAPPSTVIPPLATAPASAAITAARPWHPPLAPLPSPLPPPPIASADLGEIEIR